MPFACANLDRPPTCRLTSLSCRNDALRAAVLQSLRDCMSVSEVVDLASGLPDAWQADILRGWRPDLRTLPPRTRAEFVARVLSRMETPETPQMQRDIARLIARLHAMTHAASGQRTVIPDPLLH